MGQRRKSRDQATNQNPFQRFIADLRYLINHKKKTKVKGLIHPDQPGGSKGRDIKGEKTGKRREKKRKVNMAIQT